MKTILVDAWNTFFTEKGIDPELHKLLETYPNKKIILTNANLEEQKEYGIDQAPYEVFSLNHNPNKTEEGYFDQFLKEKNLKPEDCVYFEHNVDACEKAKLVGIKSHHYDHNKRELSRLKEFLDTNL